ncbi:MAG TPA: L-fucose/L-arabinose isomerase family protein [Levilinea sp.]|nr:L-fucose/L-arabinose isomerase family protein [Levilinea sp.]
MCEQKTTLGVIVGNRDFFPDRLISEGRRDLIQLFREMNIEAVMLDDTETKHGSVETYAHAKACAELFRKHASRIEGILVCLPNFGDEKGVADAIKLSGLNVPILVQAYPDDLDQLSVERRRDSFCGKISVCNNLRQYGYAYTLTGLHTVHPLSIQFKTDLKKFTGVCKVERGLRGARLGAVGARPAAFNTVRYSEKLLQFYGISVTTIDLSEILSDANRMADDDERVRAKLGEITGYARSDQVPNQRLVRMAKLGIVLDDWMRANDLQASALQCWTSLQKNYGINVCTLMSMMSQQLLPSACEVDITGVMSMYALQLASNSPSALVDWNNNYGDNPDRCVFFHCGNWAKSFLPNIEMGNAPILGSTLGIENTYGTVVGHTPAGPLTFARISTDDVNGMIRTYAGEGVFTSDSLETFGSRAVVEVPGLQRLMKYICKNGFEHHVAMSASLVADILAEAFETYFGWDVYRH